MSLLLLLALQDDVGTVVIRKTLEGLGKDLETVAKGKITLVWVVDRSPSMTDDRDRVSKELDKIFVNFPADKKLKMGVVAYDEKASVVVSVTSKIAAVKEALVNVGPVGGGTENVGNAVVTALTLSQDGSAQRVLVILTDEKGDDDAGLHKMMEDVKRSGARVYVFGRESVFGFPFAYEKDEKSGILVPVNAGPETAGPELLQLNPICCWQTWDQWCRRILYTMPERRSAMSFFNRGNTLECHLGFDQDVKSGFGTFALERLCRETGGRYFPLVEKPSFKPEDLVGYEPEWVTPDEWRARAEKDPLRKTVVAVLAAIAEEKSFDLKCKFANEGEGRTIGRNVAKVDAKFAAWIEALDAVAKTSVGTGDAKPYRRWEANRDLLEAQLWAMRHYLEQYRLALDEGPYPTPAPSGYWVRPAKAVRGDGALKKTAEEKLAAVQKLHPGTPWAKTAELLAKKLKGFEMKPAAYGSGTPSSADR